MQLHGPPRLAGIARALFSIDGPLEDAWSDESRYVRGRGGRTRRKGPGRFRPSYRGTFTGTATEWLAFRSDLEGDENGDFLFCARTRADGDPDWLEEFEPVCRVTSDLTTLTPIRYGDVYRVEVEIEGVTTYAMRAGAINGGFTLEGQDTNSSTIGTYGDATITPGPPQTVTVVHPVTGADVVLTIESVLLGTPAVVAARVTETPDGTIIHTRED